VNKQTINKSDLS